jgi:hypothetical protein
MARARKKSWQTVGRRLLVGVATCGYLAAALGLPVPVRPVRVQGVPYLCQGGCCGCRNAEDCWRHCCCHTPAERHAWARANGITPPDYAEPDTGLGWNSPRQRDLEAQSPPCHCEGQDPSSPCNLAAESPGRGRLVWRLVGLSTRHCQGVLADWSQVNTGAAPPPRFAWNPDWPCQAFEFLADDSASPLHLRPPLPPPRGESA